MALRHAVLATLLSGEASGYELAKRFDVSVANFWHALPQQLYAELRRLEDQGLVRGRAVRQRGRPDKRVFAITRSGREALAVFAAAPAKPGAIKDDLMVKVQAAAAADRAALADEIEERGRQAAAKLERYERLADALGDPDGADLGPSLTLARGIAFERETVAWCAQAAPRLRAAAAARRPAARGGR
jgi:DNA-binding PadR family transcriptional regulator